MSSLSTMMSTIATHEIAKPVTWYRTKQGKQNTVTNRIKHLQPQMRVTGPGSRKVRIIRTHEALGEIYGFLEGMVTADKWKRLHRYVENLAIFQYYHKGTIAIYSLPYVFALRSGP